MRLLINATILNDPAMSGLGVYALSLLKELLPLLNESGSFSELCLLGNRRRLVDLLGPMVDETGIAVRPIATSNPLKRLAALNHAARAEPGALFYSPTHHGVLRSGVTQVVTIHDLFALHFPGNYRLQTYYFKWYVPRMLRKTSAIISDSESTARDLIQFYGPSAKSSVVYIGLQPELKNAEPVVVPQLAGKRFFLFVGPSYSYKNCDRLIDAYAAFRRSSGAEPLQLVFAGGRRSYIEGLQRQINERCPELAEEILFLGYVSNGELAWLYSNAAATAIATLYEGFGLPALEAMHFDCPVLASDLGSLPEVCGDAALYVDPYDTTAITNALQRLSSDTELRDGLVRKGRENLKRFDWKQTAEQVFQVLTEVSRKRG